MLRGNDSSPGSPCGVSAEEQKKATVGRISRKKAPLSSTKVDAERAKLAVNLVDNTCDDRLVYHTYRSPHTVRMCHRLDDGAAASSRLLQLDEHGSAVGRRNDRLPAGRAGPCSWRRLDGNSELALLIAGCRRRPALCPGRRRRRRNWTSRRPTTVGDNAGVLAGGAGLLQLEGGRRPVRRALAGWPIHFTRLTARPRLDLSHFQLLRSS